MARGGRAKRKVQEEEEDEFEFEEEDAETKKREDAASKKRKAKALAKATKRRRQSDDDTDEYDEEADDDEEEEEEQEEKQKKKKKQKATKDRKFKLYRDKLTQMYENDPINPKVDITGEKVAPADEKRASAIEKDELNRLIQKMMRYLLFRGSKMQPIFKSKLNNDVMGAYKKNRITTFVLGEAQKCLREIWGYDLVPAPQKSRSEDFKGQMKDCFFLVRKQRSPDRADTLDCTLMDDMEKAERGLLTMIFGVVAAAQEWKLKEVDLYRSLHSFDDKIPLEPTTPATAKKNVVPDLGNIVELIDKFIKLGFIARDKNAQDDNEITLGPRAYVDFGRNQILQFQSDALGHDSIDAAILKEMQDNAKLDDDDNEEEEEVEESQPEPKKSKKKKKSDDDDDDEDDDDDDDDGGKKSSKKSTSKKKSTQKKSKK